LNHALLIANRDMGDTKLNRDVALKPCNQQVVGQRVCQSKTTQRIKELRRKAKGEPRRS
jgi:hypothetical protein